MNDNVNHPGHYTAGGIECIDAIEAALTEEEFRGFCKGNAMKYAWREKNKGGLEDLCKAQWYLHRLTAIAVPEATSQSTEVAVVDEVHSEYRILEEGEDVLDGDEWEDQPGVWRTSKGGFKINYEDMVPRKYRRRVDWRILKKGEIIEVDDERYMRDGTWEKTNIPGNAVEDGTYRRRTK